MLSGIRRLVSGLRHDYFGKYYVAMMKAFIDDSGSGGDSPWFVLAGYIATVENWDQFDSEWKAVLDGPPRLDYFKSVEAERLRRDEQWSGITPDDRDRRIDALVAAIGRCASQAIYVRLKQQDYDEVIKPYGPPEWDNAYFWLFIGWMAAATTQEKYQGAGEPMKFIFDNHERFEKPSLRLYDQVMDIPQFAGRVVGIDYEDDKVFLPLQAADLLAWQVRRKFCVKEPAREHFYKALACPRRKPYNYILSRHQLVELGQLNDRVAKEKWSKMGLPEKDRPWKRPPGV